jgi:hypothetical protein
MKIAKPLADEIFRQKVLDRWKDNVKLPF